MKIGILAIQGSVIEHRQALEELGVEVVEVRRSDDLKDIDGIILPGGESTTISKLLKRFGLFEVLRQRIKGGLPVWGTCAGAVLLAKEVTGKNPPPTLEVMDVVADRNAYGRQLESFVSKLSTKNQNAKAPKIQNFKGIFIRAPKLKKMSDSDVQVLTECNGDAVMMRQGNMLVTSFHPELADDLSLHEYFKEMCS